MANMDLGELVIKVQVVAEQAEAMLDGLAQNMREVAKAGQKKVDLQVNAAPLQKASTEAQNLTGSLQGVKQGIDAITGKPFAFDMSAMNAQSDAAKAAFEADLQRRQQQQQSMQQEAAAATQATVEGMAEAGQAAGEITQKAATEAKTAQQAMGAEGVAAGDKTVQGAQKGASGLTAMTVQAKVTTVAMQTLKQVGGGIAAGLVTALASWAISGITKWIDDLANAQEKQRRATEESIQTNKEAAQGYSDNAAKIRAYAKEYGELRNKQRSASEESRLLQLQTELAEIFGTTTEAIYAQAGSLDAWAKAAESAAQAEAKMAAQNLANIADVKKGFAQEAMKGLFTAFNGMFAPWELEGFDKAVAGYVEYVSAEMDATQGRLSAKGVELNKSAWAIMTSIAQDTIQSAFETINFDAGKEGAIAQVDAIIRDITEGFGALAENPQFFGAMTEQKSIIDRVLWGDMSPEDVVTATTENIDTMRGLSEGFFEGLGMSAEAASEKTSNLLNTLLGKEMTGGKEALQKYFDTTAMQNFETAMTGCEKSFADLDKRVKNVSEIKKYVKQWDEAYKTLKKAGATTDELTKAQKDMRESSKKLGIAYDGTSESLENANEQMALMSNYVDTETAAMGSALGGLQDQLVAAQAEMFLRGSAGLDTTDAEARIVALKEQIAALVEYANKEGISLKSIDGGGKGGGGGGKKKDDAEEAARKAEEARKEAIQRDYDYIDHKRHLNEITLEEELALLEKIRANHLLNAEEIMDWERKVYDLKKELRERDEESIDKLGDSVVDALEARYEAMRDAELDRLDESRKAWEQWRDDSVKAIEDQIAALDKLADTEDREKKDAEELRKIAKIKQDIEFERDEYSRMKLQQQLDAAIAAREERLRRLELEDQKEALRDQIKDIEEKADKELDLIDKEEEKIEAAYDERLKEAALRAEAEKLILTKNQDELLALLKEYAPEYDALGKTLGEKLADGFAQKVGSIATWFENFNSAMINFQNQIAAEITGTMDAFQTEHQDRQNAGAAAPMVVNQTVQFYEPVETPNQVVRRMEQVNEALGQILR